MLKQTSIIIGVMLVFVLLGILYFSAKVSITNDEAKLRINAKKQTQVCAIVFDDMWKIIKKKAQIPEHYKNDFKEIILADNQAYGKDGIHVGGMLNTIQKVNPDFDSHMYDDLMQTIESEMKRFEREQKTLVAISEQHEILISTFPGTLFLSDAQPIEIKLITSGKTKNVYETGEDNDTDIFENKEIKVDSLKK
jgi:hypothetical protein